MTRSVADVRIYPLSVPLTRTFWFSLEAYSTLDAILVEVETDDGMIGLGQVKGRPQDLVVEILEALSQHVIGADSEAIDELHQRLFRMTYSRAAAAFVNQTGQPHSGSGAAPQIMAAIAGIDIALWDLKAKRAGLPLWRLLGGTERSIPAYASGGYYDSQGQAGVSALVEEMVGYAEMGYSAMKMKVGGLSLDEDVRRVRAVRRALPDSALMLDANTAYDVRSAIEAIRAFEPMRIFWFEEPVAWFDSLFGLAKLREVTDVPLSAGERECEACGCRNLVTHGGISYLQVDATRAGGVSEWMRIALHAGANGVAMAPHHEPHIHGHLMSAIDNSHIVETFPNEVRDPLWSSLYSRRPRIESGHLILDDDPGLGVDVDHEFVERYSTNRGSARDQSRKPINVTATEARPARQRAVANELSSARQAFGALQGLKVLDLGNMIAGPFATALLADFGAEVVKVEHPVHGDDLRRWPPHKDGHSLWWKVTARNKRAVTLDLSKPSAREIVRRAVRNFDVVVENFRPGTIERWGIGYDELRIENPRVILTRVSGYGQDGPYSHRPGYGTVAEALSGVPAMTGFPDKPPTFSAFPLVDCLAGLTAAMATLVAVFERDVGKSNEGQIIDVSLFESLFRLVETQVTAYDQLGTVKQRAGNRLAEDSPRNAYTTSDGRYIAVSAGSQRTFSRLVAAMDRADLGADQKYASPELRVENAVELDAEVARWFAQHTLADISERFEAGDVVAGPVYDIRDIVADPHFLSRNDIIEVMDGELGAIRMPGIMPKLSRTPGSVRHAGKPRGADNRWFYLDALGLTEAELTEFEREGVV